MGFFRRLQSVWSKQSHTVSSAALTGEWEGHYTQYREKRPIKASLVQDGDRISGTMIDLQTETNRSLFEAALAAGLAPGADETIDAQVRALVPGIGNEPVYARTVLPSHSRVNGSFDGTWVRFTKVYEGQAFVGYQVGDQRVGWVREGHSVEYTGRLSSDARTVEGNWTIYQTGSPKRPPTGSFSLTKV